LFGRLEDQTPELLYVGLSDSRCNSSRPGSFQGYQPRDAQLDRFFRHPGEPLAVTGSYCEGQLRLSRLPFRRSDFDRPFRTVLHQHTASTESGPIQHLHLFIFACAPNAEMVGFAFDERCSPADDGATRRN
jgi:hypothetical protein